MQVGSSRGVTLAVHHLGGSGEPLLVCHATGFHGRAYQPMAEVLVSRFAVWAIDFRGHGDSTRPEGGDFSWDGMADDVLATVAELGGGPVAAFGHSMGGAALLAAETAHPGTLRCAYLYEPIVVPDELRRPDTHSPLADAARRRYDSFPSKAEALLRYASRPGLGVLRADALAAYVEHGLVDRADGTVGLKCRPEDEARTFEAGAAMAPADVAGVAVPVTVALGERVDGFGPHLFAPVIAGALPNATLRRYAHLGHFGPLQDPDTVGEHVAALAGPP